MIEYDEWLERAERIKPGHGKEHEMDLEELGRLAHAARELGTRLEPERLRQMHDRLLALLGSLEQGREHVANEIGSIGRRKAGVRGFSQLRTKHLSQRLHRRA